MENYSIKELKIIIRKYNLHNKISNYSKQTKEELIKNIKKHLNYNNGVFTSKILEPIIYKSSFDTSIIKLKDIKKEEPLKKIYRTKDQEKYFKEQNKMQIEGLVKKYNISKDRIIKILKDIEYEYQDQEWQPITEFDIEKRIKNSEIPNDFNKLIEEYIKLYEAPKKDNKKLNDYAKAIKARSNYGFDQTGILKQNYVVSITMP